MVADAFGALAGALLLGGYKYYSNRSFVSEKNYEDDYRVMASLMVEEYSGESAAERVGTGDHGGRKPQHL